MNVAAVVFDLDGTLLDSLADIAHAANTVLESHTFPTHDVLAYRYFVGDGVRKLLRRTVPESDRDNAQLIERLVEEFTTVYQQTWNVQTRLYEGVPELLCGLAQRNIAMAVLSNKPQEATKRCVDYYLSAYPFTAVLGQQENRPPKPDLTGVREIVRQLHVPPQDCLYLGDTAVDMQTARGAEMTPIGASWGFREVAELRQAGAQVILDDPRDLLALLEPPASC